MNDENDVFYACCDPISSVGVRRRDGHACVLTCASVCASNMAAWLRKLSQITAKKQIKTCFWKHLRQEIMSESRQHRLIVQFDPSFVSKASFYSLPTLLRKQSAHLFWSETPLRYLVAATVVHFTFNVYVMFLMTSEEMIVFGQSDPPPL